MSTQMSTYRYNFEPDNNFTLWIVIFLLLFVITLSSITCAPARQVGVTPTAIKAQRDNLNRFLGVK